MAQRVSRSTVAALASPARGLTGWRRWTALVLRLAGVGLLAWIGWVHWTVWHLYYRNLPTNGPLFLLDAIAAAALAVLLLVLPRAIAGLAAAGFVMATIAALLISLNFGLFGFHESTTAPFVGQTLWLESAAVVVLLAWTAITARAAGRRVSLSSLSVTAPHGGCGYPYFAPATTRALSVGEGAWNDGRGSVGCV